jgi:DNA-directed RNA polymerase subunit H (RpoH/RPB5)
LTVDLDRFVAVKSTEGSFLGRLCWYTVPEDIWVSRDELERKFQDCGLKPEWMPKPIRPSDAFRRASALLQRKNIEIVKDELYANILVREVASSREEIERHLIWETVDSSQKHLSYRRVATLRLEKAAGNTASAVAELAAPAEVMYGCDHFGETYDHCLTHYDGNGIRKCVGQIVYALMATAVRPSGAVYFVPEKYARDLSRMGRLTKELGAEYFEIPLMDAQDTRDMVVRNFIHQTSSMIESLAEVLKDPKATRGKCLGALDQSKHLIEQVKEYKSILQVNMADLEEKIKLLGLQAMTLIEKTQELKTQDGVTGVADC